MTGFQEGNAGPGAAGEAGQLPFTVESCGPPPKCAHNHFPLLSTLHGNQPDRPKTEQRFRFWLSNPNGQSHLLSSAGYAGASSLTAGPKPARPAPPQQVETSSQHGASVLLKLHEEYIWEFK